MEKLHVQVLCKECGEPLETILENQSGHYSLRLSVVPCEKCLEKAEQSILDQNPNSIEIVLNDSEKAVVSLI